MIEVKKTVKLSDEQVNTWEEIQTAPTENISNAVNNIVQEKNEEWRKPVETRRKSNVHKTFRRRPGRLLNVLC